MRRLLPLAATLTLTLPAAAGAASYVVDDTSTRAEAPCTREAPCTFQYVRSQALAGEEILVLAGTYSMTGTVTVAPGVRLRGDAGPRPVFEGANLLLAISGTATQAGGIEHIEARRTDPGAVVSGFQAVTASDLRVQGGVTLNGQRGVLRDSIVTVSANNSHGLQASSPGTDPALWTRLVNSTVIATGTGSYGAYLQGSCAPSDGGLLVTNSIVRGVAADLHALAGTVNSCTPAGVLRADHSNFRTAVESMLGDFQEGEGNQREPAQTDFAALFDDPAFHLKAGSPAIDAGAAGALGPVDFDGDPRTLGALPDIGADEFPGTPSVTTDAASAIGTTGGTLNATVTPAGRPLQLVFDHGPTTAYGTTTAPVTVPAGPAVSVGVALTGLVPSSVVHYRARVFDGAVAQPREAVGADASFTTGALPPVVVPAPVFSNLNAAKSIRHRALRKPGLKVAFVLRDLRSSYVATLTVKVKRKTRRLARRTASNQVNGPVSLRLKSTRKLLRGLPKKATATLTVTVTSPSGAPLTLKRAVTLRR